MHIKLLKFTLIAPYLPPYKKPRPKAGGQFEEFIEMIPSIPKEYIITYRRD